MKNKNKVNKIKCVLCERYEPSVTSLIGLSQCHREKKLRHCEHKLAVVFFYGIDSSDCVIER